MGKKDLYVTVPSFFRCPISLDVMKSPVSLSTGVTYDRVSIQRWLDTGNNTCPATMQVLDSKDFVPNHTLHRLIKIWSNKNTTKSQSVCSAQVTELISRVSSAAVLETRVEIFVQILCFASESSENKKFLATNSTFVARLVDVIATEGPDLDPILVEAVLKIFQIIASFIDMEQRRILLLHTNPKWIPILGKILRTANSDSRIAVVRILEMTAVDQESKKAVFDSCDILPRLLDILRHFVVEVGEIQTVLSCLVSLTSTRQNKLKLIQLGCVPIITNMLSKTNDSDNNKFTIIELQLTLLEMLVGCAEGRASITEDANCVLGIIHKLMKTSRIANEHAVAILWSLCYLFRDQKARESMTRSNGGLTKILLLMQSDCSTNVKKMCCDLLRIFRVNSKSCLSSYDTKTTHIMPC